MAASNRRNFMRQLASSSAVLTAGICRGMSSPNMSDSSFFPTAPQATPQESWRILDTHVIGEAGPGTDLFIDPFDGTRSTGAPTLLFPVDGDFMWQAHVRVQFSSKFDAGVLLLFRDESNWAKLCFEFSPQSKPTIVSVVNRGVSDDCNSTEIPGEEVYLRISRRGQGFAFHYSEDARYWSMVRAFRAAEGGWKTGFLVQSPSGKGCRAEFHQISFSTKTLSDIRSGE